MRVRFEINAQHKDIAARASGCLLPDSMFAQFVNPGDARADGEPRRESAWIALARSLSICMLDEVIVSIDASRRQARATRLDTGVIRLPLQIHHASKRNIAHSQRWHLDYNGVNTLPGKFRVF